MNKIYKVIWNATLGTWVAVSELAKGKTKSSKITGIISATTVTLMVTFSPQAFAAYTAGGGTTPIVGAGTSGIAIGNGNAGSAAVGSNGAEAIAIGATTRANGSQSTVIGNDITGNGDQSVIIGSNYNANMTTSTGLGGVAVGSGLTNTLQSPMANGIGSVAIGSSGDGATNSYNGAVATGNHALALMAGSQAISNRTIAVGVNSNASNIDDIAIGTGATASGLSVINGSNYAAGATAIGANAVASAFTTTAIGNSAKANAVQSTALGYRSIASGQQSVAVGNDTSSIGYGSVAIGGDDLNGEARFGQYIVAQKWVHQGIIDDIDPLTGKSISNPTANAVAANGYLKTQSRGVGSTAIGTSSVAYASGSTVIGTASLAKGKDSTVVGTMSYAAVDGSIALGSQSVANTASGIVGYVPTGTSATNTTAINNTKSTLGVLSVGGISPVTGLQNYRQITNVAAGTVDSDAVNVAQLKGSTQALIDTGFKVGGNTNPNTGIATHKLGNQLDIVAGNLANTAYVGDNISTEVKQDATTGKTTVSVGLKSDSTFTSITAGSGADQTVLNKDGLTIAGGPSITDTGINAGNKAITNVASGGTTSTNAANIGDVQAAAAAAKTIVAQGKNTTVTKTTDTTTKNDTYTVNADSASVSTSSALSMTKGAKDANGNIDYALDLSTTTKTDIKGGVDAKTAVDTKGLTFNGDGGTTGIKKLGDAVAITGDTNITTAATTAGVQVKLNPNLAVDSITAGTGADKTVLNKDGLTITGGPSITDTGINAGNSAITNVASGGTTATNAANIGDVQAAAAAAKTIVAQGKNTTVTKTTDATTKNDTYTVNADSASVSTSGALSVTKGAKDANGNIDYALDLSTTTKTDIKGGVDAKTAVDTKGLTFNGDGGTTGIKKLGDAVAITGDTNITTAATTAGVQVKLNPNLAVDSITAGNTTVNNSGIKVDDGAGNVTNVTAGGTTVTDGTNTAVYDADGIRFTDTTGNTLTNAPSISQGGIDAGGTTITNVGGPSAGSDAANKDYVDSIGAGATTAGLNFAGDSGKDVHRDLGQTVKVVGGETDTTKLTTGNIGVVADGTDKLTVQLAKNIDLGADGSVKTGNTKVDNNGVKVDDGAGNSSSLTTAGTTVKNAAGQEALYGADKTELKDGTNITTTTAGGTTVKDGAGNVTNVTAGGTTVTDGTNTAVYDADGIRFTDTTGNTLTNAPSISQGGIDAGGTTITNVGGPSAGSDAANKDYVDSIGAGATTAGLNFAGDSGKDVHRDLGQTVKVVGGETDTTKLTTGNIGVVADGTDKLTVQLAKNIDLGADGSVKTGNTKVDNNGVKVDDGAGNSSSLTTAGTTVKNAAGQEALYGADKTELKDGTNITTTTAGGTTVKDGAGNVTNVTAGGTTVTDGTNTAVYDADGIRFTDTTGNTLTNAPSISQGGIDAGGTTITNVGGPSAGSDAANKDYVDSIGAGATTAGLNFAGDSGKDVHRDLGQTVKVVGGETDTTKLTTGNIGVVADGTDKLTVQLAKNIDLGADGSVKTGNTKVDNNGVKLTMVQATVQA